MCGINMSATSSSHPPPPRLLLLQHGDDDNGVFRLLPVELWWSILGLLSPADLHQVRRLCRKFRWLCHRPQFWARLDLGKPPSLPLLAWDVRRLQAVVTPYTARFVQSIRIEYAGDMAVCFLVKACPLLQDLTVCGWRTLSHHALKGWLGGSGSSGSSALVVPPLRRLCLLGYTTATSATATAVQRDAHVAYAALDANVIAQLIRQCRHLEELHVVAHAPIHLATLCHALVRQTTTTSSALHSLTLSTAMAQRADGDGVAEWEWAHALMQACPRLRHVQVVPVKHGIAQTAVVAGLGHTAWHES